MIFLKCVEFVYIHHDWCMYIINLCPPSWTLPTIIMSILGLLWLAEGDIPSRQAVQVLIGFCVATYKLDMLSDLHVSPMDLTFFSSCMVPIKTWSDYAKFQFSLITNWGSWAQKLADMERRVPWKCFVGMYTVNEPCSATSCHTVLKMPIVTRLTHAQQTQTEPEEWHWNGMWFSDSTIDEGAEMKPIVKSSAWVCESNSGQ